MRKRTALVVVSVMALAVSWAEDEPRAVPAVKHETGKIEVPGGSLFYEVSWQEGVKEDKEDMVLVHNGLLHSVTWEKQIEPLSAFFRVVAYDRRGYGRSTQPEEPYSDLEDLEAVFEQLGIERAVVMGMSAGGRLTVDFAIAHPDMVSALVLVGPVVSGMGYTDHFMSRGGHLDRTVARDPERRQRYWFTDDPYSIIPANEAARRRAQEVLATFPHNLDGRGRLLRRPPSALEKLGTITVPVLIVAGEYDIPDVHAHVGALDAGIPDSRRVIISDAGHLVPMEQPETFNRVVLGFLEGRRLLAQIEAGDAAAAQHELEQILGRNPGLKPFEEQEMNIRGYQLLADGELDKAIAVFELNVLAYPESWNVHDSLGEALAMRGDLEAAAASYSKSLELNPGNENGAGALERLQQQIREQSTE